MCPVERHQSVQVLTCLYFGGEVHCMSLPPNLASCPPFSVKGRAVWHHNHYAVIKKAGLRSPHGGEIRVLLALLEEQVEAVEASRTMEADEGCECRGAWPSHCRTEAATHSATRAKSNVSIAQEGSLWLRVEAALGSHLGMTVGMTVEAPHHLLRRLARRCREGGSGVRGKGIEDLRWGAQLGLQVEEAADKLGAAQELFSHAPLGWWARWGNPGLLSQVPRWREARGFCCLQHAHLLSLPNHCLQLRHGHEQRQPLRLRRHAGGHEATAMH
mmetsp:Transcript_17441/g.39480  ORF Transcript_17441/g.39480 Transcript_17441/m.39480 type:complete len:272 (+) Transcript_17441:704-1519(+)